ncbi:MAG: hypothetical protein ACYDCH_08355 [Gaiellaceae bacterium]
MGDAWFTGVAEELARFLVDARDCAAKCESLLDAVRAQEDTELQLRTFDVLIGPAAVARVLIDLIDEPQLVLAAARLFFESSADALPELTLLERLESGSDAAASLRQARESCRLLLDAAG